MFQLLEEDTLRALIEEDDCETDYMNTEEESEVEADHISADSNTDSEIDADIPSSNSDSDDLPLLRCNKLVIQNIIKEKGKPGETLRNIWIQKTNSDCGFVVFCHCVRHRDRSNIDSGCRAICMPITAPTGTPSAAGCVNTGTFIEMINLIPGTQQSFEIAPGVDRSLFVLTFA
ncbi:hypothetical protein ACJJTC_014736 [Scirpophaga incertulas]